MLSSSTGQIRSPDSAFWSGRRVLVTGHTGFKGAWLCSWLTSMGATVTGFALPPEGEPGLYVLTGLDTRLDSRIGDVRDVNVVAEVVAAVRPNIIFHLAAQALVRPSYIDPIGTYATNVMGTVNLLEGARQCGDVRAVVVVTSDKCYENREWIWPYRENDPMGGHDPYSSSKGCAELVVASWRRSFFGDSVGLASVRAGNVFGGGDRSAERLVPDCVAAFELGRAVEIRNPSAVRPWQHVLDPLCGYLLLAEDLARKPVDFGEAWNFGPDSNSAQPVQAVVERLATAWGNGATAEMTPPGNAVHEATLLQVDSSKARDRLRWAPRLSLERGIELTVEWYRQQRDATNITAQQIALYGEISSSQLT